MPDSVHWIHDGDRAAVAGEFEDALRRLPPEMAQAGRALVERIATPNWALEWGLPRWLGGALDLPEDSIAALVVSNAFGLATVRLIDDLVDGELDPGQREGMMLLATALHGEWLRRYGRLFGGASLFWEFQQQATLDWLGATDPVDVPPQDLFASAEPDALLWLARRGAPLRLCGVGACLLGSREATIPVVEAAVNRLLVAGVLLDHAHDWADDLRAGRYNALVAYYDPQQGVQPGEAGRRAVLEALLLGDGGQAYFSIIEGQVQAAREAASEIPCPELAGYLDWFSARTTEYGRGLAAAYQGWLRDKTVQVFGPGL